MRGLPLQVHAFEGNKAETKTILPVIEAFAAAHQLPHVTVVADAGMLSEANLGRDRGRWAQVHRRARHPDIAYEIAEWRRQHPCRQLVDGQSSSALGVMGSKVDRRRRTIFYQYRPTGPAAP